MKWFEITEDLGDGSTAQRRFKTQEELEKFVANYWEPAEVGCYPFGDVEVVDTDSSYFWTQSNT